MVLKGLVLVLILSNVSLRAELATRTSVFTWENSETNPIAGFKLSVSGPRGVVATLMTNSTAVSCVTLLGGQPPGSYTLQIVAVGTNQVESAAATLVFDWELRTTNPSIVSPSPEPPNSTSDELIVMRTGGILRSNQLGMAGLEFVAATNLLVTHLGRWVVPGNTQPHLVRLLDPNLMVLAATKIETATADPDRFAYAALATPLRLIPQRKYFLCSSEMIDGDAWFDCNQSITLNGGIVTGVAAVTFQNGEFKRADACAGPRAFGPVSFKFAR